ncbi:DMT family transporter [Thalassorhabdomicrobium marinisediminis]|uniref:EamA domain-containing protein n=1 Tax=Thalassorhabdomicrobium marinisediminis TaxID=2170577 RepID=A0A2T7FXC0_9RHOB|nr:DMT family transporter [Thalassorhabdomicrobium marinisediminis]PVA06778.1 hypothetical protein DC363_09650 [Thalassorhabdomicrobium marinisediminis]
MSEAQRGTLALVMVAALGSIMGVFSKALSPSLEVTQQVALRCALGAAVLLPLAMRPAARARIASVSRADLSRIVVSTLSIYVMAISLNTFAYVNGKYGAAATVMALPFSAFLGFLLYRERFSGRQIATIVMASLGAVIVIGASFAVSWGDALAMLAALGSAFFMSLGIMSQRGLTAALSIAEKTFLMLAIAALVLLVLSAALMGFGQDAPHLDGRVLLIGLIAGVANVGFLFGTNYGVKRVHATIVNNALALQTVFAAVVAWLVYDSLFTPNEYIGAALIVLSVLLHRRTVNPPRP